MVRMSEPWDLSHGERISPRITTPKGLNKEHPRRRFSLMCDYGSIADNHFRLLVIGRKALKFAVA